MTQTWWLSFTDSAKPKGSQFIGVAVVDVTEAEAALAKAVIDHQFPQHQPGAEWIAAASTKAWATGCNPGGELGAIRLDDKGPLPENMPRHRLMDQAELIQRGLI